MNNPQHPLLSLVVVLAASSFLSVNYWIGSNVNAQQSIVKNKPHEGNWKPSWLVKKSLDTCATVTVLGIPSPPILHLVCGDTTTLSIDSLPEIETGHWANSNDNITIVDPTSKTLLLENLPVGSTLFSWQADTVNCTTYVPIRYELLRVPTLLLEKDSFLFTDLGTSVSFNIFANDPALPLAPVIIHITQIPKQGILIPSRDGHFDFIPAANFDHQDQFNYQVCYEDCLTLCTESSALFEYQPTPIEEEEIPEMEEENMEEATPSVDQNMIPNTITPNEDGFNDQLVFPQLINSFDFPNNELLIFNRWGDQVYFARPYDNTWKGTDTKASPLREGTYYYILRLDVGSGKILRGAISILR